MRPFFLFIFLLLTSVSQSFGQEYLPLIKKGREVNTLYLSTRFGPLPAGDLPYRYYTETMVLTKDSIINGLTYSIPQYRNPDNTLSNPTFGIPFREDSVNRKIYFIHPILQREVLYFDASASVGDTITISRAWHNPSDFQQELLRRFENFQVVITRFDSIRLGANKLKTTLIGLPGTNASLRHSLFIEGLGFTSQSYPLFEWIFTFHSELGPFCCNSLGTEAVTCISDPSGRVNYTNPQYDSCVINLESRWPLSTAKQIQEKALEVYPNPTAGELKVKGLESLSSETAAVLIDAQGKTVWQGWLSAENATVPMSLQPRGLYLLQVGGQSIKVLKE